MVAVGSKTTSNVTFKPGFKVTGKVAPDMVKPAPVSVPELMVTGADPAEVKVTGTVDGVFTATLPNATLVGLMLNAGPAIGEPAAFSCRVKLSIEPSELAVRVTACADVTADMLAVNPALDAFAGTTTMAGTATAALLLARLTLTPPLPAAVVSVTVQRSLPDPVIDELLQESALKAVANMPAFVVAPELQPDIAMTMRQHASNVTKFVQGRSSLQIGSRLQLR
jgi:hypothetical protein